jgi:hypothetical protein
MTPEEGGFYNYVIVTVKGNSLKDQLVKIISSQYP